MTSNKLVPSAKTTGAHAGSTPNPGTGDAARALLAWYDQSRRTLPWRYAPGIPADAYRVWLSEIMLQQTTVATVIPYFDAFTRRWPTVSALANASLDDVRGAWAGLGYYSRARNLHACAQTVASRHEGSFPSREHELRALPGVGPYTAAAIAAIAFGQKATVVDGNVERVVTRLFAIETPLPQSKPLIRAKAALLTPDERPGDYAQAMMDLGATICTPRAPKCAACPIKVYCQAEAQGLQAALPHKLKKKDRPIRRGTAYVAVRSDGAILVRKRPAAGLLGGMLEVPSTPWLTSSDVSIDPASYRPLQAQWTPRPGVVVHVFTHFRLEMTVECARIVDRRRRTAARPLTAAVETAPYWLQRSDLDRAALPTLMRKIIAHALD